MGRKGFREDLVKEVVGAGVDLQMKEEGRLGMKREEEFFCMEGW